MMHISPRITSWARRSAWVAMLAGASGCASVSMTRTGTTGAAAPHPPSVTVRVTSASPEYADATRQYADEVIRKKLGKAGAK